MPYPSPKPNIHLMSTTLTRGSHARPNRHEHELLWATKNTSWRALWEEEKLTKRLLLSEVRNQTHSASRHIPSASWPPSPGR